MQEGLRGTHSTTIPPMFSLSTSARPLSLHTFLHLHPIPWIVELQVLKGPCVRQPFNFCRAHLQPRAQHFLGMLAE